MAHSISKKTRIVRWLSVLGAVLLIAAGAVGLANAIKRSRLPGDPLALPLPDLQLSTLEGETVSMDSLAGKPALINFWATWCPPCVEEMPVLEALQRTYGDGLTVVAVNVGETPQEVQAYLAQHRLTLPVLLDQSESASIWLDINYLPTSLFVDRRGVVRSVVRGGMTWQDMQAGAEALLH